MGQKDVTVCSEYAIIIISERCGLSANDGENVAMQK
jgi:hypothetical protein